MSTLKNIIKKTLKKLSHYMAGDLPIQQLSIRSLENLSPLITNWAYIPITDWAAGPLFYVHLLNEIIVNGRQNIIECGSGISTILIARLIKINKLKINFFTIDQDYKWQEFIKNILVSDGIDNLVNFKVSHIVKDGNFTWYDKKLLNFDNDNIDMLIVDGPIGDSSMARLGAVPHFIDNLSKDSYSIFLHDTDRDDEKEILKIWKQQLSDVTINTFYRYSVINKNSTFTSYPQTVC